MSIEVEVRSFVNDKDYRRILAQMQEEGKLVEEGEQVSYYFDGPHDLRIQKTPTDAKVWLKSGAMHEAQREEIEIHVPPDSFEKLHQLFTVLGYRVIMRWYRTRYTFSWRNITVMIDDTKGYGKIIELENVCEPEQQEQALATLEQYQRILALSPTPLEEFDQRFQYYKNHWKELIGNSQPGS